MESYILKCLVFIISLVTLIGFFITKKEGFGKFTLSSLLLIMVISIASLLYLDNRIDLSVQCLIKKLDIEFHYIFSPFPQGGNYMGGL